MYNSVQFTHYDLDMYIYHLLSSASCFHKLGIIRQLKSLYPKREGLWIINFILVFVVFIPETRKKIHRFTFFSVVSHLLGFFLCLFWGTKSRDSIRKHAQFWLTGPQNRKSATGKERRSKKKYTSALKGCKLWVFFKLWGKRFFQHETVVCSKRSKNA